MSLGNDMPDDPGAPANTDPEGASPNEAEAAVDEARLAQETPDGDAPEGAVDGENVAEELDDIDAEVDGLQDDPDVAVESAEDDAARDLQDEGQEPVDDGAGAASPVEKQLEEMTADLKRVSAEYTNYRRRAERDRAATFELAKAQVASDLLPMADDFDLAEKHGDLKEEGPLKVFSDKFTKLIADLGVEKFGQEGDAFDPNFHEAVQDMSSGDEKTVATVLRAGYRIGDRVLRTAMVVIGDPE
ncbi:nucleotide exchange factor GrpE [uncultured Corynebacterium sp.]|uniref:nucleotide exchange factor GrpE n=1 Tax=uncultured Corynebacterium sp. TaxID=159447 RepID=UPI0025EB6782|nr:nucleotide exchange factor GrpE [uncultured Corynebacterium sp.]